MMYPALAKVRYGAIGAHLTDTKTYGFPSEHRGQVGPGDPIHGMWVRMTINEDMLIVACEAASDHTPFAVCTGATPAIGVKCVAGS